MIRSFTVKLGLTSRSATEIVAYVRHIIRMLTGNPTYPTPTPALDSVSLAVDGLEAATEAALNGGRMEHQAKRDALRNVHGLVKELAGYVQSASGGDQTKILSSGFGVRRRPEPIGQLPPPVDLRNRLTDFAGRAVVDWKRVYGAHMYHVYMSTDVNDPTKWELIGVTTKTRFDADNLESGRFYWFAVTALGTAGESTKSDPARAMAA